VSLTRELAVAVTERTEGWPAGLYLAAVIAAGNDVEPVTVSGDDRWVADYLYRESLVRLPESVQRFLRRAAVLDQLSAPLCEAVLGMDGRHRARSGLEALELDPDPAGSLGGSGTGTTRCSGNSCSVSFAGSRPTPPDEAAPAGRRLVA
jgi:hypothetical protein